MHVLEVPSSSESGDVYMVKEYVRAGAGYLVPDAQELRPPDVLIETIHYLIAVYVNF